MRLEYYFRETASGLRRNGIVAFAAMSTAFIALFLFGLALLIARQFNLVIEAWTGNVQVAVYLTDPVRDDTVVRIQTQAASSSPAVGSIEYWDKAETCAALRHSSSKASRSSRKASTARRRSRRRCASTWPTRRSSIRSRRRSAARPTARPQEIQCTEPGVRDVSDYRDLLDRLTAITRVLSIGVLSIAVIMLASAIALVANTLRMGMFARRKEIGIMRLVGATNWRIRVPFLIEGLVEALIGADRRPRGPVRHQGLLHRPAARPAAVLPADPQLRRVGGGPVDPDRGGRRSR